MIVTDIEINKQLLEIENKMVILKRMSINEFLDYVNDHKDEFIYYCEIIIDSKGYIYLARPSHQEAVISIACQELEKSREEILKEIPQNYSPFHWIVSKYNMIGVWYGHLIRANKINRYQCNTLKLLKHHNLIDNNSKLEITEEYQIYLQRKEKGLEE